MYDSFQRMSFSEIVDFTIDKYAMEKGREKAHKLYTKVMTSNKLSGLIAKSRYMRVAPTSYDIMACIAETPFFLFKSNFANVCAAVMFLHRWNDEVNSTFELKTDDELKDMAIACYARYKE